MRALQFITDRVIFRLHYNQVYQMKITLETQLLYNDCYWYTLIIC